MKAAFICNNKYNIDYVYSRETQDELKSMFKFYDGIYTKDESVNLKDVEFIFSSWGFPEFTEDEIKALFPKLKIVFYAAGSVQYFARPFLNSGIIVISAWMANSVPVIEYTVAQIILANKGFYQSVRMTRSREGRKKAEEFFRTFKGNYNSKIGIIGLGAIGAGVAERLKAYAFDVYAYDPFASKEKARTLGVNLASLEEIFEECDVISNHVANLHETQGMFNQKLFSKMKKNATFINTGRGAQVVEDALIYALENEPARTAVLDVTYPEPPVEGSKLYNLDNVFLTPHIAGSSGEECKRMGEYIKEDAVRFCKGEPLLYNVTLKMLETMA